MLLPKDDGHLEEEKTQKKITERLVRLSCQKSLAHLETSSSSSSGITGLPPGGDSGSRMLNQRMRTIAQVDSNICEKSRAKASQGLVTAGGPAPELLSL